MADRVAGALREGLLLAVGLLLTVRVGVTVPEPVLESEPVGELLPVPLGEAPNERLAVEVADGVVVGGAEAGGLGVSDTTGPATYTLNQPGVVPPYTLPLTSWKQQPTNWPDVQLQLRPQLCAAPCRGAYA